MLSYARNVAWPRIANTLVIAAVKLVLPWSTWPIVPMLQCGLLRSNFAFAIFLLLNSYLGVFGFDFVRERLRDLAVVIEFHRIVRAPLGLAAQLIDVAEHVGQRHHGGDNLGVAARILTLYLATTGIEVADHAAKKFIRRHDFHLHDGLEQLDGAARSQF